MPTRRERQLKEIGRIEKVKKREKITLDKGKIVAFSIYRLCFAKNTSLNSKSVSQRLKKKVRREKMQVELDHQT